MKNFLIVLTLCASGVSSVFAQTPAADAKAAVKAAPAAAKAAAADNQQNEEKNRL